MSTPSPANKIHVASVSDRGLSEKRPMNEDSFVTDAEHRIFAVADGVGGAEAGEVASQTAIDVLQEAFRHQLGDGDDVEDLMELSIQRANSSIHQMAAEHPRFSMMATTIVALHLDRGRATIGHVGDSRLYRVSPDGQLVRETADHSIVEEEVRAGRMTPEQAAHHPSKNVISRALGAEESVEVDMKTIEVEDGTRFLLCTDGITRHIPDMELRQLLTSAQGADAICAQMKERCYERGAEDNLTAVIVEVGEPKYQATFDGARTQDLSNATAPSIAETHLTPPSRIAFPGPDSAQTTSAAIAGASAKGPGAGRAFLRFFIFLLFIGVAAGAFYGGMKYQHSQANIAQSAVPQATPDNRATFEQKRADVDADPQKWLGEHLPIQLSKEGITKATDSRDSEFLYFYGRALMLSGNHRDAMQAFELSLNNLRNETKANLPLGAEVKVAQAAAALKLKNQTGAATSQEALMAEQKTAEILDELLGVKKEAPANVR
jgi:serine/threonine protein phosphatase PrpC